MEKSKLLTIKQVCELLQISRPTFNRLRKEKRLKEFYVGMRVRFHREEVVKLVGHLRDLVPLKIAKVPFNVFYPNALEKLQFGFNAFDLGKIESFDPHGVLILFCSISGLASKGHKICLRVADNFVCNHLRTLGFFVALEKLHPEQISWNRSDLKTNYEDVSYPIPLTEIALQKQEAPIVERLIKLLRQQGFSENICAYIGWVIGELVDNAMTHLIHAGQPASCYILAQRFKFLKSKSDCLIVGIADLGPGIHKTLKTNPDYFSLSDKQAFLMAFKERVTSWKDIDRGKGLTDVLGIAMGNGSVLRAESSEFIFEADFRTRTHKITESKTNPVGTRFTLVLIDHEFSMKKRLEVNKYIDSVLEAL